MTAPKYYKPYTKIELHQMALSLQRDATELGRVQVASDDQASSRRMAGVIYRLTNLSLLLNMRVDGLNEPVVTAIPRLNKVNTTVRDALESASHAINHEDFDRILDCAAHLRDVQRLVAALATFASDSAKYYDAMVGLLEHASIMLSRMDEYPESGMGFAESKHNLLEMIRQYEEDEPTEEDIQRSQDADAGIEY